MLAVIGVSPQPAAAHGQAVDIVVEGLSRGGENLGVVDYGIALTFVDGDPVRGAQVRFSVTRDERVTIDPVEETVPGVYIGRVTFPGTGEWRVEITFDHPDTTGSVVFTQVVREPAPAAPLVLVDTADPDRVGTVALDSSSILGGSGTPSPEVGDHSRNIIVEAFIADAIDPLLIEYALAVEDTGVEVTSVRLTAVSDRGHQVGPVTLTAGDGVYRGTVRYPAAAIWTVNLQVVSGSTVEDVVFKENLPWPHYTTEAGSPKVKYDSAAPSRIGTIVAPEESIYLGGGQTPMPPTRTTPEKPGRDEVEVDIVEPAEELTVDIGLRILHLASLGLWTIPLAVSAFLRSSRLVVATALVGMALTVVSGVLLALWGAPVTFPGMLRWAELGARLYGPSYQAAFLAKMAVALVAVVGTAVWARRRYKSAVYVTFGALAAALIAVTAMSQFHLFSHL